MLELLRTRRVFNKLGLGLGLNIGTHNQNINVGKHVTYTPPHPKTTRNQPIKMCYSLIGGLYET